MSEQKQQPIISIDHVSMRFNLAKEKHESLKEYFVALLHGGVRFDEFFALSDVSFDIMPGDFYGLIGLNGSGSFWDSCKPSGRDLYFPMMCRFMIFPASVVSALSPVSCSNSVLLHIPICILPHIDGSVITVFSK